MSEELEKNKTNEEQNQPQEEQPASGEEKNESNPQNNPNEESQPQKEEEKAQENEEQKDSQEKPEEKKEEEKKEGELNEGEKKDEEEEKEEEEEEKKKEGEKKKVETEEERKKREKEEEALKKKFAAKSNKSIQEQIEQETIQIEQKKIDLRIMKERLVQKKKLYNELQGKPVEKTSEEKEKERRDKKKANKNHKFTDPIDRKKGREKQLADEREKTQKEEIRKRSEFQKLTTDINELIISNKDLKAEIVNLRKRKGEILKKKKEMEEEIEQKKAELENMNKRNEVSKSQIMYKEYKNTVTEGEDINKDFEEERDELENEYQKIREEYIKREREAKKENAKKRNMAAIALSSNKGSMKSSRDKDIELEIKKLADEQIMDRTPMLDISIKKWREINNIKKTSIQIFQQNSTKIREALKKLTKCVGLDSFEQLPLIFKKTEQQMSNINMYKEKLEVQNDKLEYEKEMINKQIELLSGKKKEGIMETSKIIKEKKKNIEIINSCAENFKKEIDIRMQLIEKLFPETKAFLSKLDNTFLSDFIANKINIDDTSEFSEKTIDKYISNVQDYFRLIDEWDKSSRENKELGEIDKLREEMKQKLGKFEQSRLISQDFYESMQLDYKKGIKLDEIIKKSSHKIALDIQNPYSKSTVLNKTIKGKKKMNLSIATTEAGNNKYGNDSSMTNKQQSSIIYPNVSQTMNNSNSKVSNDKIAETA